MLLPVVDSRPNAVRVGCPSVGSVCERRGFLAAIPLVASPSTVAAVLPCHRPLGRVAGLPDVEGG